MIRSPAAVMTTIGRRLQRASLRIRAIKLDPVHHRHQKVGEDERWLPAPQSLESVDAMLREDAVVALFLQQFRHRLPDVWIVLDDQHRPRVAIPQFPT